MEEHSYIEQFNAIFQRQQYQPDGYKRMDKSEFGLYIALLMISNEVSMIKNQGKFFTEFPFSATNSQITKICGIKVKTIEKSKVSLKDKGLIDYVSVIGKGDSYTIHTLKKLQIEDKKVTKGTGSKGNKLPNDNESGNDNTLVKSNQGIKHSKKDTLVKNDYSTLVKSNQGLETTLVKNDQGLDKTLVKNDQLQRFNKDSFSLDLLEDDTDSFDNVFIDINEELEKEKKERNQIINFLDSKVPTDKRWKIDREEIERFVTYNFNEKHRNEDWFYTKDAIHLLVDLWKPIRDKSKEPYYPPLD